MVQLFLIAFALMCLLEYTVIVSIGIVVGVIACIYRPDLFTSSGRGKAAASRTGDQDTSGTYEYITYKQQQDKNVERGVRPDFDPKDAEYKEQNERLRKVIARNKEIAEREAREELDKENLEKFKNAQKEPF